MTISPSQIAELAVCTCIPCSSCNGSGNIWIAFDGTPLGNSRCDDLDELDNCPECGGSGLDSMCDNCQIDEEEHEAAIDREEVSEFTPAQRDEIRAIVEAALLPFTEKET